MTLLFPPPSHKRKGRPSDASSSKSPSTSGDSSKSSASGNRRPRKIMAIAVPDKEAHGTEHYRQALIEAANSFADAYTHPHVSKRNPPSLQATPSQVDSLGEQINDCFTESSKKALLLAKQQVEAKQSFQESKTLAQGLQDRVETHDNLIAAKRAQHAEKQAALEELSEKKAQLEGGIVTYRKVLEAKKAELIVVNERYAAARLELEESTAEVEQVTRDGSDDRRVYKHHYNEQVQAAGRVERINQQLEETQKEQAMLNGLLSRFTYAADVYRKLGATKIYQRLSNSSRDSALVATEDFDDDETGTSPRKAGFLQSIVDSFQFRK